jgi:hypothetical protein
MTRKLQGAEAFIGIPREEQRPWMLAMPILPFGAIAMYHGWLPSSVMHLAQFALGAGLIVTALLVFMLPTMYAYARRSPYWTLVLLINVALGLTVVGWLVALAIAMFTATVRK